MEKQIFGAKIQDSKKNFFFQNIISNLFSNSLFFSNVHPCFSSFFFSHLLTKMIVKDHNDKNAPFCLTEADEVVELPTVLF